MGSLNPSTFHVLCLVLCVVMHSVTANIDSTSIESMVKSSLEKFEQNILETLQTYLQHHNNHMEQEYACEMEFLRLQNITYSQHKEVIEKVASHEINVQQLAESINNLRESNTFILERLSELHEQLRIKHNDLLASQSNHQKQMAIQSNVFLASQIVLLKQFTSMNHSIRVCQSDHQKQLMSIKTDLLAGQSNLQKELKNSTMDLKVSQSDVQKQLVSYYIRPYGTAEKPFLVLIDLEDNFQLGGGWTVFQSRFNGSKNFYQNWAMYKNGFGDVNGEHWLGLEKLHAITRSGRHELLVVLEDFDGNSTYALYDDFKIGSEAEKFKLTVGKYSGTAGDSLIYHNGMKFSTVDQDNDLSDLNCAETFKGAWWFSKCYDSHLNGQYHQKGSHLEYGVEWIGFRGGDYSLKSTKMMLRSSE